MTTQPQTYLAYLDNSYGFEDEAKITAITVTGDGRTALMLNRTIFYPQGGGQPADNGLILSSNGKFAVSDVRLIDGDLLHIGTFAEGSFAPDELVKLSVMKERRMLNARLHSAGHLIDLAIQKLDLNLKPAKGYHFPDSPYVEYEGKLESIDKEQLAGAIQAEVQRLIALNLPITAIHMDRGACQSLSVELPSYLDRSKPIRIVSIGDNPGCPCGGTHVKTLHDLGHLEISKIRSKADKVKVSYLVR